MSGTNGKRWSREKYLQKRAEQREKQEPEWVTNPDTGNEFFLRRVGAMAYAVAGAMPHNLTNKAFESWQEKGITPVEIALGKRIDPRDVEKANRDVALMAKVIGQACMIPKLVPGCTGENDDEIDPVDLDDSDVLFIFKYGTGQVGGIKLKDGEQVESEDLQTFSEQPGGEPGVSVGGEELLPAT